MKINKFFDSTMIRFIIVGIINTVVGTSVMFILYNFAGCGYWLSSAANYVVGSIVSYFLNKNFTFGSKDNSWKSIIRFIVNISVCYFLAYGVARTGIRIILSGQIKAVQENVAMLAGMIIFVGFNYLGQRFFVFGKNDKK